LDGDSHRGLTAGRRSGTRPNLYDQLIAASESLRAQISLIKFAQQGLRNVHRFDVSVKDFSFHEVDYNLVCKFLWRKPDKRFMKQYSIRSAILIAFVALLAYGVFAPDSVHVQAQQPTETPITGMYITVITEEPVINVRMGPNLMIYPVVGKLARGATAPALGRSFGGDWIQIEFPGAPNNMGWVYSPLVQVSPGTLRISEPPPTPIPPATATIDPTFAAQFTIVPTHARLPTFTPPPALTIPSYTQAPNVAETESVPLAMIIIALAILGIIGFTLSVFIKR